MCVVVILKYIYKLNQDTTVLSRCFVEGHLDSEMRYSPANGVGSNLWTPKTTSVPRMYVRICVQDKSPRHVPSSAWNSVVQATTLSGLALTPSSNGRIAYLDICNYMLTTNE